MPSNVVRVEECPNCNHPASAHLPFDASRDAACLGADDAACRCPLDRAAVAIAIGIAAALVKYG